ncbi:MAG: tetratricopeptide repeat protein [Candidatus Moraniibacteriota bacterium]
MKKWLVAGGLFLSILFGIFLFKISKVEKIDYVIHGVPYFGAHNHVGPNRLLNGSWPAVLSLLEYWEPDKYAPASLTGSIKNEYGVVNKGSIIEFFTKSGYIVNEVHLENNELTKYINSNIKTPLFVFLPLSSEQSKGNLYYSEFVIIGVDNAKQKIITHNFWFGNNYEISFSELDNLWGLKSPEKRKNYIVIQPQDLAKKIDEMGARKDEAYPERTITMKNCNEMIKNYAVGFGAESFGLDAEALAYFLKVENDSNFEKYLPPYFKSATYYQLGNLYLKAKNIILSTAYAQKSIDANHDLDKPFNDWPGFESNYGALGGVNSELRDPWVLLGDISLQNKNYQKAKESYERALIIVPNRKEVADKLKMVETALSQAK